MKKLISVFSILLVFQTLIFAQQVARTTAGKIVLLFEDGSWCYADSVPLYNIKALPVNKLEIPKTTSKENIITHTGYSLSYNETHEQANWIAYDLTEYETKNTFSRTDKFSSDPKVRTGTASNKDYEGSGYDRGHLAPAADMGFSSTTMIESFYYSNISPQNPGFNRGIWKRLEELVRSWAVENSKVYIVTGPVLTKGLPTIGLNKVSVPDYFYKVILDYNEPGIKGIGFVIPNKASKNALDTYAVTVDSVEKITGLNFFPLLPDDQEAFIEGTLCIKCWSWNSSHSGPMVKEVQPPQSSDSGNQTIQVPSKPAASSVQCSGYTKAGNRCKRMTTSANGRCYQH